MSGSATVSGTLRLYGARAFDGSGDYLWNSSFPALGSASWTIGIWVKWDGTASKTLFQLGSETSADSVDLAVNGSSRFVPYAKSVGTFTGSSTSASSGTWQFVAIRYINTSVRLELIVDGVQDATTVAGGAFSTPTVARTLIGARATGSGSPAGLLSQEWSGSLAHFCVWSRAVPNSELLDMATNRKSPLSYSTNLVEYFPILGTTSPEPSSVTADTLTVVNAVAADGPALLTAADLAAALLGSASTSAALTTAISMASALSAAATTSANLTTAISLAASVTGSATVSGSLLATAAALVASVSGSANTSANLTTAITLAGSVSGSATTSAVFTTAIRLTAGVTGTAAVAAALENRAYLNAAVIGRATVSASFVEAAELVASVLGSAHMTGLLDGTSLINRDEWDQPEEVVYNSDKTQPTAQWHYVDVVFPTTPNTDLAIRHNLAPLDPEHINYMIVRRDRPGNVYHDISGNRTPWRDSYIFLRSDVPDLRVRLLLMVEHGYPTLRF